MNGNKSFSQDIIRSANITKVCYAGNKVTRISIPPPEQFYKKAAGKGAQITVNYSGFTLSAKKAFEYAVSILSSLLPDDVAFTINAAWGTMSEASVLGNSSVAAYIGGAYFDAFNPYAYYPVTLAEKIAGTKYNPNDEGDILINLNSEIPWYTGTDAKPSDSEYDLVTVVLHELIHGLGFTDSFNSKSALGSYGLNSIPLIYDSFIMDENGSFLTDTTKYENNSNELNSSLLGGPLYFDGPVLNKVLPAENARLYAPGVWDPGSSISHLNEYTYTQTANALMTPFIDKGEAIHAPGNIVIAMLAEMGWINTRISHKQLKDTESNISSVILKAAVKSDTSFNRDYIGVVYSWNDFASPDTLFLVPQSSDTFKIGLPVPSYNSMLRYYFFAADYFDRIYKLPAYGEEMPYDVFIGTDTIKPELNHIPIKNFLSVNSKLSFTAEASDDAGIDTVYAEYRKNTGPSKFIGLKNDSLDIFRGSLNLGPLDLEPDDSVQYRIIAVDKSSGANEISLPDSGYYIIKFSTVFSPVEGYSTDFTDASSEYINNGFSIATPERFSSPALHTTHPYESPDRDNESIEYTSVLRYPVKIDETGIIISFKEIVLVEPGEEGSVYGSEDFYDYVVVEGSKDMGNSWFPMIPGYDSRASSAFLNVYNSSFKGNNSTASGVEGLYRIRTIDIRTFDKFKAGDTLVIRFRLYSDPYAHGWGWAIDDLNIKSVAAGISSEETNDVIIYPNPGNGNLRIDGDFGSGISYRVMDFNGTLVKNGIISSGNSISIDITGQPPGIYFIVVKTGKKVYVLKYTRI